jgi:hydrogenase 3 maturation protease
MSILSWNRLFAQALQSIRSEPLRLALLGIGSELYGDDAAGILVVRQLRAALGAQPDILVIETGSVPENFTAPLRRFQPDLVVMIDAAQMGEPPGTVRWIEWADVEGFSASTHHLPPTAMASYLKSELGCQMVLLGIQVGDIGFDRPLTDAVRMAVDEVGEEFRLLLSRR